MREKLLLERVSENMKRLRLTYAGQLLEPLLKEAQNNKISYLGFLNKVLDEEVSYKEQRRIETNLRLAGLPFIKSIDEFDFSFQPKLDQKQVLSLFDLSFLQKKENLILLGPPGVGKTHLAVALAVKACQAGFSIYSTTMEELIKKLKADHESKRPGRSRSYHRSALVIVDEIGYTPISREECNLFFRFIANRYERNSIIITSNKPFSAWTELFNDPIIVTAILDRLLHHSIVINISGKSFRIKEKTETAQKEMSQK